MSATLLDLLLQEPQRGRKAGCSFRLMRPSCLPGVPSPAGGRGGGKSGLWALSHRSGQDLLPGSSAERKPCVEGARGPASRAEQKGGGETPQRTALLFFKGQRYPKVSSRYLSGGI